MPAATRAALEKLRAGGRRVLLVTGRRLDDLQQVCPDLSVFDGIVAENGAVYLRSAGDAAAPAGAVAAARVSSNACAPAA